MLSTATWMWLIRFLIKNAMPRARGTDTLEHRPLVDAGIGHHQVLQSRTRRSSAFPMALFNTFSNSRAPRCGM